MSDARSIWCEHCRDHFAFDHYDDDGRHGIGDKYGEYGALLAAAQARPRRAAQVRKLRAEVERLGERVQDLQIESSVWQGRHAEAEAEVERLRAAARKLSSAWRAGDDIVPHMVALEDACGFTEQGG